MTNLNFDSSSQVNSQGRVTIPRAVREALKAKLEAGSLATFVADGQAAKIAPSKIALRDEAWDLVMDPSYKLATINRRVCLVCAFGAEAWLSSFFLIPELGEDGRITLYLFANDLPWTEMVERDGENIATAHAAFTISVTSTIAGVVFVREPANRELNPKEVGFYTKGGRQVADIITDSLNARNGESVRTFIDNLKEL